MQAVKLKALLRGPDAALGSCRQAAETFTQLSKPVFKFRTAGKADLLSEKNRPVRNLDPHLVLSVQE